MSASGTCLQVGQLQLTQYLLDNLNKGGELIAPQYQHLAGLLGGACVVALAGPAGMRGAHRR